MTTCPSDECETCEGRGTIARDVPGWHGEHTTREEPCPDCGDDEPPEPDGEDFRGGEAAGYLAEQMSEWQKLK